MFGIYPRIAEKSHFFSNMFKLRQISIIDRWEKNRQFCLTIMKKHEFFQKTKKNVNFIMKHKIWSKEPCKRCEFPQKSVRQVHILSKNHEKHKFHQKIIRKCEFHQKFLK